MERQHLSMTTSVMLQHQNKANFVNGTFQYNPDDLNKYNAHIYLQNAKNFTSNSAELGYFNIRQQDYRQWGNNSSETKQARHAAKSIARQKAEEKMREKALKTQNILDFNSKEYLKFKQENQREFNLYLKQFEKDHMVQYFQNKLFAADKAPILGEGRRLTEGTLIPPIINRNKSKRWQREFIIKSMLLYQDIDMQINPKDRKFTVTDGAQTLFSGETSPDGAYLILKLNENIPADKRDRAIILMAEEAAAYCLKNSTKYLNISMGPNDDPEDFLRYYQLLIMHGVIPIINEADRKRIFAEFKNDSERTAIMQNLDAIAQKEQIRILPKLFYKKRNKQIKKIREMKIRAKSAPPTIELAVDAKDKSKQTQAQDQKVSNSDSSSAKVTETKEAATTPANNMQADDTQADKLKINLVDKEQKTAATNAMENNTAVDNRNSNNPATTSEENTSSENNLAPPSTTADDDSKELQPPETPASTEPTTSKPNNSSNKMR